MKHVFSVSQAAEVAGWPTPTIRDWIKAGVIVASTRPPSGPGREMLFSFEDVAIAGLTGSLRRHGLAIDEMKTIADTLRATDWETAGRYLVYEAPDTRGRKKKPKGKVRFVDDLSTIDIDPTLFTVIDFKRAIDQFRKLADEPVKTRKAKAQ